MHRIEFRLPFITESLIGNDHSSTLFSSAHSPLPNRTVVLGRRTTLHLSLVCRNVRFPCTFGSGENRPGESFSTDTTTDDVCRRNTKQPTSEKKNVQFPFFDLQPCHVHCRTVSEAAQKNDRLPYLLRNDDLVSIRELLLVLLLYDNHNLVISFRQLEALDLRWSKVMKAAQ